MAAAPNIEQYGLIGNCRTAALVSDQGSIDWYCVPRFDAPSLFAKILDPRRGGSFSICPLEFFSSHQAYISSTNVLKTSFEVNTGRASLVDCFTVTSESNKRGMLWPNDEILRIIHGEAGVVRFQMRFDPRPSYGSRGVILRRYGSGHQLWGLGFEHGWGAVFLQCSRGLSDAKMLFDERGTSAVLDFSVTAGENVAFSLTYDNQGPAIVPPLGSAAFDRFGKTIRYWRTWISQGRYSGMYADYVRRSALALKLLNYAPSGAIVAAPTSSLPEWIHGARNWDYRFCWLRDASFTVRALVSLGFLDEAKAYVSWLLHSTRLTFPRLQVVYNVFGKADLSEQELPFLSGYRDSRPVRIGNAAAGQIQLDVYGEVMDAFFSILEHLERVDRATKSFLIGIGRNVAENWRIPDDGIWELRSERAHHTHSKLMCWVALKRLHEIASRIGWALPFDAAGEAAAIRSAIEKHAYNAQIGAYTRSFESQELDASLLIMPLLGYCGAKDPRFQSTIAAIQKNLTRNHLVYRYRITSDGFNEPEGTFGICNFWMAQALASARNETARYWFEAMLRRGNHLGLWSEEINPLSGEYLGNYPQGFSHIGLINAARDISSHLDRHSEPRRELA